MPCVIHSGIRQQLRHYLAIMAEPSEDHTLVNETEELDPLDVIFEPELDRKYTCPVCLGPLMEPVQTKCGHRFCKSCFEKSNRNGNQHFKCPVDNTVFRRPFSLDVFADNAARREVMSLTVVCMRRDSGCVWTGEFRQINEHMVTCPEVPVECPHTCGLTVRRGSVGQHAAQCARRPEHCTHCGISAPASDLTIHQLLSCPRFPVTCSVCGEPGILRSDIPKHVDIQIGECPLVVIKCDFDSVGCYFQDKRKNMAAHYENGSKHHMILLTTRLVQQQDVIQNVQRDLDRLHHFTDLSERQQHLLDEQCDILMEQAAESGTTQIYGGALLWKVNVPSDYSFSQISPVFFAQRSNYKFKLILKLNQEAQEAVAFQSEDNGHETPGEEEDQVMATRVPVSLSIVRIPKENNSLQSSLSGICEVRVFDRRALTEGRQDVTATLHCNFEQGSDMFTSRRFLEIDTITSDRLMLNRTMLIRAKIILD